MRSERRRTRKQTVIARARKVPIQSICFNFVLKSPPTCLSGRRNQMMRMVTTPTGGVIPEQWKKGQSGAIG